MDLATMGPWRRVLGVICTLCCVSFFPVAVAVRSQLCPCLTYTDRVHTHAVLDSRCSPPLSIHQLTHKPLHRGTLPNSTQPLGRKLIRGAWNAQSYGPLYTSQQSGLAAGTDFYFNKNRLSGLWGAETPLSLWLKENGLTTLFFGGVNIDQCVWSTLVDAYFRGYDVILVDDASATVSP